MCVCVCVCVFACVHVHVHVHVYVSAIVVFIYSRKCVYVFCLCAFTCTCIMYLLINCCLHLLSLQNGLTALEVARASTDKVWDEEEEYWDDEYSEVRQRPVTVVHDYDGVVDLLSGYTAEPAVLPSHPVSGTITTSSH